jgi:hypothetical protein
MPGHSPDDLYGLPLPQFIPERTALVKALRNDKRRDEATAVAAMRKPSVAAWAVNQLVRTQSASLRALFKAGDDLAKAQSHAASGKPAADELRAATHSQRDAIGELLEAAQGLLSSDGHPLTASTLERVSETLRAASIDSASREQVKHGCLHQELEFAGLGIGELSALTPESSPKRTTKSKQTTPGAAKAPHNRETERKTERKREAERKAERTRAAEVARKRKAELATARKAEADARHGATRADKELAAAQTQQRDAAAALQEAEERLAAAVKRAEKTAAELKDTQRFRSELEDT